MATLSVHAFGKTFQNPVIPAAGPNVGSGRLVAQAAEGGAGGLLTKTISRVAAQIPHPNMARFGRENILNAELWSELPPEAWFEREYDLALNAARQHNLPIVASAGYTGEDLTELGPRLERIGMDMIEFSVHYLDPQRLADTARALRAAVSVPIIAKLSLHSGDLGEIAAVLEPYVDGFTCINSLGPGLIIDVERVQSPLGSKFGYGWMSGPVIKPLAVRSVFEVARATDKPVIGVGGVSSGADVIEFLMAGAALVGVCTAAILKGPGVYGKIAAEVAQWLDAHGYSSIDQVKGLYLEKYSAGRPVDTGLDQAARVDASRCKACGQCERVCQYGAMHAPLKQIAHVEVERCAACGLCASVCAFGAIELGLRSMLGE
ncbi:dihydroorotate dehydrogenase [Longilinea arvoryzae]|uniref:Dihydrothymine dehydrogenase n=1 Tax=Longilinea arvoryzae TaxID=360412 RepID=A0A0S7B714_9CHLR|nr:4Fe-4S binding protein [Longilinea arvoryzae]GAP13055.1 dihydroorotate dehydrogenase [Longilinea arvoryzae]